MSEETVEMPVRKRKGRDGKILDIIDRLLILPRLSKRARTYLCDIRSLVANEKRKDKVG
jgi:hypothetical protein